MELKFIFVRQMLEYLELLIAKSLSGKNVKINKPDLFLTNILFLA